MDNKLWWGHRKWIGKKIIAGGDIKRKVDDLAINIYDSDAIVYKMHGDIRSPQDAVISKDDYERYGEKNSLFVTALRGGLSLKNVPNL